MTLAPSGRWVEPRRHGGERDRLVRATRSASYSAVWLLVYLVAQVERLARAVSSSMGYVEPAHAEREDHQP